MASINGTSNNDILYGTEDADSLIGLGGDDRLIGRGGNDVLNGGTGADNLRGGFGDDRYYVDNARDAVVEYAGEGVDTVYSSVSYRLRDNVENLYLTGSAISAVGNSASNRLIGTAGNNILDGAAGADVMSGGFGDDRYYVDDVRDVAFENAGQGIDTVYSSVNYRLRENVENLYLTGSAIRATGNTGANRLFGTAGNNILDGAAGADDLRGGLGNDRYYVDNAGDRVSERADEGLDSVYSSVSFRLAANVEQLFLTGSAAINATGNALHNLIAGNSGNNFLNGGAGNDTMSGGLGNDGYFVDSRFDVIVERTGEGTDTIRLQLGTDWFYTIPDNVENLLVVDGARSVVAGNSLDNVITGGAATDNLNGMGGNDTIRGGGGPGDTLSGGDGNDRLIGGSGNDDLAGGSGADTLTSGAGVDGFIYSSATDSTSAAFDTITDFTSASGPANENDYLVLSQIDANENVDGNQSFQIMTGPQANSIWFARTLNDDGTSDWILYGDVNGDAIVDLEIHIHVLGVHIYTDDIIL